MQDIRALMQGMLAQGESDAMIELIIALLDSMRSENDTLVVRLKTALRKLYGRSSEKTDSGQMALFSAIMDELGKVETGDIAASESTDPTAPAGPDNAAEPSPKDDKKNTGAPHGRGGVPADLPVVREDVPLTAAQRKCPQCESETVDVAPHRSWKIEFIPGQFVAKEMFAQRACCPHCKGQFVQARAPKVIAGSLVGEALLARVLVDKAEDHLPLDRQRKRMEREGLCVPQTTLDNWWKQGAELLMPLHLLLKQEVMNSFLPQIDATGIKIYHQKQKELRSHYFWCAVGGHAVFFSFADAKTKELRDVLALRPEAWTGQYLPTQSDGDSSFAPALKLLNHAMLVVQCNMHARRNFDEAAKNGDLRAKVAMKFYTEIYQVERECTEGGVSDEERGRRRQELTVPILERFHEWAMKIRPKVRPTSPLGKALNYVSERWISLTCFVSDGRIPIDNGEPERNIRWIAKGRDNWNLCGSAEAAQRLAVVASLCATCRRLKRDPARYFTAIFTAIANGMDLAADAALWTPWAWAARDNVN